MLWWFNIPHLFFISLRSSYLDNDWFTFDTVGTLLVGWDGGPSRSPTRHGDNGHVQNDPIIAQLQQLDADEVGKAVTTAIEVAALATVGKLAWKM